MTKYVAQVTPAFPPSVGGIEDHVSTLCESLEATDYEPIVITPDRGGTGENIQRDTKVHREKVIYKHNKAALAPGVARRLLSADYDLIHVHAPFHFGQSFSTVASQLRQKPLVITAHMYDTRGGLLNSIYNDIIYNTTLRLSDAVITTTDDYVSGYDVFSNQMDKRTTVPLSVNHEEYKPVKNAKSHLDISEDENILLFVGAMEEEHFYKDIELLFDAFEISEEFDRLILVGSGDRVPRLKNAALRKGLRDKIDFPGYITNEMLPTYMSAADVFVLPSKSDRGEAFGIVLLEAMSCGTPVVAADIPGVADVPENGGVTYDVGSVEGLHDALQRALHENFTPRRTVREYYTTAQMCSQVIDIYDSVIQG